MYGLGSLKPDVSPIDFQSQSLLFEHNSSKFDLVIYKDEMKTTGGEASIEHITIKKMYLYRTSMPKRYCVKSDKKHQCPSEIPIKQHVVPSKLCDEPGSELNATFPACNCSYTHN